MGCPENKKSFLFFKWLGPHEYSYGRISRWGPRSWAKYEVTEKCTNCGVSFGRSILSEEKLLHRGLDVKKLQNNLGNFSENIDKFYKEDNDE
jgi:hypothetical protein